MLCHTTLPWNAALNPWLPNHCHSVYYRSHEYLIEFLIAKQKEQEAEHSKAPLWSMDSEVNSCKCRVQIFKKKKNWSQLFYAMAMGVGNSWWVTLMSCHACHMTPSQNTDPVPLLQFTSNSLNDMKEHDLNRKPIHLSSSHVLLITYSCGMRKSGAKWCWRGPPFW